MSINRQQRRDGRSDNGADPSEDETEGLIPEGEFARADAAHSETLNAEAEALPQEQDFVAATSPVEHRFAARQFLHEVNVELRKVAWPSRQETINYSAVVFITLVVMISLIFGLDYVFTKLAGFLFNP